MNHVATGALALMLLIMVIALLGQTALMQQAVTAQPDVRGLADLSGTITVVTLTCEIVIAVAGALYYAALLRFAQQRERSRGAD